MKRYLGLLWPALGIAAAVVSLVLLVRELRGLVWEDVAHASGAITGWHWTLALASTLVAYGALAWYDRIAFLYLGRRLPWRFVSAVSFTTYALSHNIGMTALSGAVVRYRAYSTHGLKMAEIGSLVAFCSFTFALGAGFAGGLVLVFEPDTVRRLVDVAPGFARLAGAAMLLLAVGYVGASALDLKPLRLGPLKVRYPRFGVALRQLLAAPCELVGAAGIIYCALPVGANPGFFIVFAIYLASFSAGLLSLAPGGLGVLELVFVTALPEVPKADVVAALIVFRLLYLIVPLAIGVLAVIAFERKPIARVP